jgi:hypothetical protein
MEENERLKLLKSTRNPKYEELVGQIGRSFLPNVTIKEIDRVKTVKDPFLHVKYPPKDTIRKIGGWDPNDPAFSGGKWCYDTPGVVNENQVRYFRRRIIIFYNNPK